MKSQSLDTRARATIKGFLLSINSRDRDKCLNKNNRCLNKSRHFVTKESAELGNLSGFLTLLLVSLVTKSSVVT